MAATASSAAGTPLSPAPTRMGAYSSIFGGVPGNLSLPPSIMQELMANVPGYNAATGSAVSNTKNALNGQLSPSTIMNMGNYAASRGQQMGQPNSPISNEIGMGVTGNTTEGLQGQGMGYYNNLMSMLGGQQLNPALTTSISEQNAVNNAAPDPQKAAWYQQALLSGLMRTSPAGKSGSGFQAAMGDISSVLGLLGSSGGKGGSGGGGSM